MLYLGSEKEGHRAIVDQVDNHMGTETPGFHPAAMFFATDRRQSIERRFSLQWRRGGAEAWTVAGTGVRSQGELADQQQAAAGVGE
ncbi:hypothetical protein XAC3218_920008 [Xanthomonas citri pv. citri]|uniref:Uncharacterized protein n=1 Tax=Xanthomonas citri pv. citri TaxID=611301 RepID=A0A0U5FJ52_XANCI|nr:hypothetical protein XAC902_1050007 [Xanthomonas citri pv. citri]CEE21529.1 hypothetical protein XAC908_1060008 [Xanthomonas citri pv. citri]CEE38605.1 hypothetical protein XAC3824_890009 [Xanthomonas citri pv. citri]CEE48727.1 hypothetical protein XAC2911_800010 [Xanthomonas citri pv. citri]CEE52877.1 hypothetical protein XACS584_1230009 [Xanthomonas citri pv. citri]